MAKASGFPGEEGYVEGDDYPSAIGESERVSGTYVSDPDLAAMLAKPAAIPWVPNPGDAVAGTVVDIQTAESEYGEYPLIELDTGSKNLSIHAYHSTLQREIERRNVKTGDKLAIAFLGEKASKTKGHNPFYRYRVIHTPKEI